MPTRTAPIRPRRVGGSGGMSPICGTLNSTLRESRSVAGRLILALSGFVRSTSLLPCHRIGGICSRAQAAVEHFVISGSRCYPVRGKPWRPSPGDPGHSRSQWMAFILILEQTPPRYHPVCQRLSCRAIPTSCFGLLNYYFPEATALFSCRSRKPGYAQSKCIPVIMGLPSSPIS